MNEDLRIYPINELITPQIYSLMKEKQSILLIWDTKEIISGSDEMCNWLAQNKFYRYPPGTITFYRPVENDQRYYIYAKGARAERIILIDYIKEIDGVDYKEFMDILKNDKRGEDIIC